MPVLHDLIDALKKEDVFEPTFRKSATDVAPDVCDWVQANIRDAVCFDMGDTKDIHRLKLVPDLFRFPYTVTWLESKHADGMFGCLSVKTGKNTNDMAFFDKPHGLAWQFIGVLRSILTQSDISFEIVATLTPVDNDDEAEDYLSRSAGNVACFLMALNCHNTTTIKHRAPILINKKRARKGKQPIFSYWTLHLMAPVERETEPNGGTHTSPRVHLRRGHIRHLKSGAYIWVNACVVGNKKNGIVHKDYAVH